MLAQLTRWFRSIIVLVWHRQTSPLDSAPSPATPDPTPPQPRKPDVVPLLAMDIIPPPQPRPSPPAPTETRAPPPQATPASPNAKINRHQRRAAERERRKYDKWVEPKGELPRRDVVQVHPAKPRVKTETAGEEPEEDELIKGMYLPSEFYGEFNFRDSILDQLDRYWVYLDRMKKRDADSYGFYKQVGAVLTPHFTITRKLVGPTRKEPVKYTAEEIEEFRKLIVLPPWFKNHRPSFGCVVYGASSEVEQHETKDKFYVPKFMYYTKFKKPPPEIQPMSGGDVYKMTIWWDRPQDGKQKHGRPTEFAVFVPASGDNIQLLKMIDTKWVTLRHTKSGAHQHRGKTFTIPQRAWHIPDLFEDWAEEVGLDPQLHLAYLFCEAIKFHEWTAYSMIRVAVHKDDLTAVFGVNARRMSYFFQDRDITVTDKGQRKKIFHLVRAHERHMKSGKVVPVRLHYWGEKEFEWAGYRVKVTVPGADHFLMGEMNIGVEDEYWHDPNEEYMHEPEFGKKIVEWMDKGMGGRKS